MPFLGFGVTEGYKTLETLQALMLVGLKDRCWRRILDDDRRVRLPRFLGVHVSRSSGLPTSHHDLLYLQYIGIHSEEWANVCIRYLYS